MFHLLFDCTIGFLIGILFCAYFPEKIIKFKKFILDILHKDSECK